MRTIKKKITNTKIIKKSKFIAVLIPLDDDKQYKEELKKVKEDYPKASHYCYAYIINEKENYYDDKEPNKSSGFRILELLRLKKLSNILVIVIRYYGGIKLGIGPLSRAYQDVVNEVLTKNNLKDLIKMKNIQVELDYENNDEFILKYQDYIYESIYKDKVTHKLKVPEDLEIKKSS